MAQKRTLSEKDKTRLEKDFTYHPPKGNQAERYEEIRGAAMGFAALIMFDCPDSRERSLALNDIDNAVMHANAAIARNE